MRPRTPRIKQVLPPCGIEGGRVSIEGSGFDPEELAGTLITFSGLAARPLIVSPSRIVTYIPEEVVPGPLVISVNGKRSAEFDFPMATRLSSAVNPVDSPLYDREGNLFVCYSGKRGENPPVSVFKISPDGDIKPHLSNVPNATSLALDRDGNLYVSSRFEGNVYRCTPSADSAIFARELGTPTGLAFDTEGYLYCGDRAGRILKISPDGEARVFAEIPESTIAFHLAFDPDGNLLVTNPGLSGCNQILMVDPYGKVVTLYGGFGRPQGMAVDAEGAIYVCEGKAGESALIRIERGGQMTPVLAAPVIVGVALDGHGGAAVASQTAIYKIQLP